ncbi:MAG: DoxX family membrane protein [Chloroflexi bacterium]|nr:DoxX family membrane protein [Chloroflexota bacterium]
MRLNTAPQLVQSDGYLRERVQQTSSAVNTARAKGIAALRVAFGLIWIVAAWLKWQPEFQNKFLDQITGAQDGQPPVIHAWIGFWAGIVSTNPLLFARIEASTETALAVLLILGLFSNLSYVVGILLSLGIWSTAEGFGGPFKPGQSTDIGTALPYVILFGVLLVICAGRYYGLDQWLTPKLGRLGFLASGTLSSRERYSNIATRLLPHS